VADQRQRFSGSHVQIEPRQHHLTRLVSKLDALELDLSS
jgi:hypothetical protein